MNKRDTECVEGEEYGLGSVVTRDLPQLGPDRCRAEPRRETNLVHSDACRGPLVEWFKKFSKLYTTFKPDQSWGIAPTHSQIWGHMPLLSDVQNTPKKYFENTK